MRLVSHYGVSAKTKEGSLKEKGVVSQLRPVIGGGVHYKRVVQSPDGVHITTKGNSCRIYQSGGDSDEIRRCSKNYQQFEI